MNNALSLLITDSDNEARLSYQKYSSTLDDVELVGISSTVTETFQKICDCLPHAVILDLELENGNGGLEVLQMVKDASLPKEPFFLITTSRLDDSLTEQARSLGAGFILYKGQGGYSEKYATDFLRYMSETIIKFYNK